jgi:addiction module HigA family antidote
VLYDSDAGTSAELAFKDIYQRDEAPTHPGEVLRDDVLPHVKLTRTALAKRLGITPRRLANLLAERTPVTADLATRLGTVLGHGARYWLGLQMQHDIWLTQQPSQLRLKPIAWAKPGTGGAKPAKSAHYR